MKLISSSVKHPHAVIVGILLCALFGYRAMVSIPMQMKPTLDKPEITITTTYRGAAPVEVEDQITTPIEEEMDAVEGVRKVSSKSAEGRSAITLEFDWGVNKDIALIDVINKLNQVPDLPEEADEPVVLAVSSDERQPVMWVICLSDKSANELFELAEDVIEPRIRRIEGVGDLRIFGGEEREVHVLVDPQAMASRGITFDQLVSALRRENMNVRGGFIDEDKRRYTIRTMGQFTSLDEVGEVIVARTQVGAVYLKELATARFGYKKSLSTVRTNAKPTVVFGVVRKSGANVVAVCNRVQNAFTNLNEEFKQKGVDLEFRAVYTEVDYINESIELVRQNLLIGGLLATAVLIVFLRSFRSVAVVALSIPVTLITVFILLKAFDRSINIISLAGLAFAVGMVVDNAIVVLENIYRYVEMGKRTSEAIVEAASEVWGAVLASTLTTLAVFVPIIFIQEEAGQLFKDIAIAISCAIGLSLLVSLTVVPMLGRQLILRGAKKREVGALLRSAGGIVDLVLLGWLGRSFSWAYNRAMAWLVGASPLRIAVKLLVVAALASGFYLSLQLLPESEYLPSGNRNFVLVFANPLVGSHLDKRVESVRPLEQMLLNDPRVERFFCVFGGRFNAVGMRLKKPYTDERSMTKYLDEIRAFTSSMPGFKSLFPMQASIFRDPGKQFDVEISGPDLDRIERTAREIEAQLRTIPGVMFVRTEHQPGRPEVQVKLDRERCAALGLRVSEVSTVIESLVAGKVVGTFNDGGKEIDLTLRAKPGLVETRNALAAVTFHTPAGRGVRLDTIAAVRTTTGPVEIRHLEKQRAIVLTVNLLRHISLERAINAVETQIFKPMRSRLPATYTLKLGGSADKLNSTLRALKDSFVLALIIIYLLMVALFESFTYPMIIMATVPLAASGAFMGVTLANHLSDGRVSFDVITMLGLVILSGIVVNNAILIVHQALNFRREGMPPNQALVESCRTRLRPIFMSATTSVFGMLPLALGRGAGSELYRGLGAALVGGLAVSTVFTLFLVPCLLSLVQDLQTGAASILGHKAS